MKIKSAGLSIVIGVILLGIVIISASAISISNADNVKNIWLGFEEERNDRLRALNLLRSEIGYGGMIHRFKNYILRQKRSDAEEIISSIGGAKVALVQYRGLELSVEEEKSLSHITNTLDEYADALKLVEKLIQQKQTAEQIDDVVIIDDTQALNAFETLEMAAKASLHSNINSNSHPLLLSELKTALGYGGLIHNFKNYILRDSPTAAIKVKEAGLKDPQEMKALLKKHKYWLVFLKSI